MKKKNIISDSLWSFLLAALAILLVLLVFLLTVLAHTVFWNVPSPTGEYEVFGWTTDVGGWGWSGKIYFKEHGLLNPWKDTEHTPPCVITWISNTTFVLESRSGSYQFTVDDFN